MKLGQKLRGWGGVWLMMVAGLGLGWGLWIARTVRDGRAELEKIRSVENALLRVELSVWLQEVRLRSAIWARLGGQPVPAPLLRQPELRAALRAVEGALVEAQLQTPLFRELVERALLYERRHERWRRALDQSPRPEAYQPVMDQYLAEGAGLLSAVEAQLRRLREQLEKAYSEKSQAYARQLETLRWAGVGGIGLLCLVGLVGLLWLGRSEEKALSQLLEAAARGERLPTSVEPLAPLAQQYNLLLERWHSLLGALESVTERKNDLQWGALHSILGPAASHLEKIVQESAQQVEALAQQKQALRTCSQERQKLLEQLQALEKQCSQQLEALQLELGAFQNLLPVAEVLPNGEFRSRNDLFLRLPQAAAWKSLADLFPQPATLWTDSSAKQGQLSIGEEQYLYFFLPYKQGKEQKGLLSLVEVSDLNRRVREVERALAAVERRLKEVEESYQRLYQQYTALQAEYSHEIERLLRQRQSLETLLKMPALQKGEVIEGLAAISEVAATLTPEARYSFWIFGQEGGALHCLEAYDPTLLAHSNSLDLPREAAEWVRLRLEKEGSSGPYAPQQTALETYLTERRVTRLWMFPVYLDEELAGVFFVEGLSENLTLDTQYPALLARVASLLLQEGHRKLVEEELLSYLEQAQALEEELRQNIEELEASAEEMRRTQAELRGQITALNAAALVAEMNTEGRLIYANESFLRLFGYPAEKLLGMPYRQLRRAEEEPLIEKLFQQLQSGETWQEVVSYRTAYGEEVWVQQTITPVRQAEGEIYKYILVAFDITVQKQQEAEIQQALHLARQQEQLLRENTEELRRSNENYRTSQMQLSAQLEALNNAAWLFETDAEGNITYATQSLFEALGYEPAKLIGSHYGALFSERQPMAILQGHWRSMQMGQVWKSEVELRGAVGQSYWAIMSSTPLLDRGRSDRRPLLKTVNVLFDITAQKEQEFRLKEQQNALSLLAAHPVLREGDVPKAFQVIAEIALQTFKAHRVSLWLYEESDLAKCMAVAEKEPHSHTPGTVVNRSLYPLYFQSLEREQVIAVVDALSDLRTRELALPLFKPNHVASVLDGIIRVGAKTIGLISVEQRYAKREWTLDEVNFLRALTASAASVIEEEQQAYARRLQEAYAQLETQKRELEEAMRDIRESIRYAKRMQKNILPSDPLLERYLGKENHFIIWRPRDRNGVGGDFYWFSAVEDSYFLVVADGTGHGVPGAFITLIGSILLDQLINKNHLLEPAQILHDLHIGVRQVLRQDVEGEETLSRDGMDIALVRYFPQRYKLVYAGANLPLYYTQGTDLKEIKPDKKAIGGEQLEEERFFTQHEVTLEAGDTFFLFTDGVVDQDGGPEGKRFGTKRLKEFILETLHEPSMPRRRALFNIRWKEWKDYQQEREQVDDVTMWGVRVW